MATKKKAGSKAKKEIETSTNANDNNGPFKELFVVALGKKVAGGIKVGSDGLQYVEGDLNAPKWRHPRNLAAEIGGLTVKLNDLPADSVKYIYRYRPIDPKLLVAEMVVLVQAAASIDLEKTRSLARRFNDKTIVQANLPFDDGGDKEDISEPEKELVDQSVEDFLSVHGGKPMPSGIHVSVGGEVVANFSGIWRNPKSDESSDSDDVEIEVYYDGRRLRQRYFFAVENSTVARNVEVHYDDNQFDEQLCALRDNKKALLKLKCVEKKIGKTTRLHLEEMKVIDAQNQS